MSSNQPTSFIDRARNAAAVAAKNGVLIQAGKAFGEWLAAEGMTPERMVAALQAGEPLLQNALGQIPAAEVTKYRGGLAGQAVRHIKEEEYHLVLKQAAMNPKAEPCATLLRKDPVLYWHHFVPAMNAVKAWFVDGTPL